MTITTQFIFFARERKDGVFRSVDSDLVRGQERDLFLRMSCPKPKIILVKVFCTFARTLMSDMVKYRADIWSFLQLTALYFTMSDILHERKVHERKNIDYNSVDMARFFQVSLLMIKT